VTSFSAPENRFWPAVPIGTKTIASDRWEAGIAIATPFSLSAALTLKSLSLFSYNHSAPSCTANVAIYDVGQNNAPSGSPVATQTIALKHPGPAIGLFPKDTHLSLEAGDYWVVTAVSCNGSPRPMLRAMDGTSHSSAIILGESSLCDYAFPMSALTLPAPYISMPLTFSGNETWKDRHAPASAPVVYLGS
jgi:hypothetical protein